MTSRIIDRGRGPEIEGTRITVYDVVDYWKEGWSCAQIAGLFRLVSDDIQAAIDYIEAHKEKVMMEYDEILQFHRSVEYSPEVKEKLARNRQKFQARLAQLQTTQQVS